MKGRAGEEGWVERMCSREGVVEGRKGWSSCITLSVLKHMRSQLSNPQYRLSKQGCVALHHMCVQVIHVDMYDQPARMPPLMVNYHKDLAKATTGQEWRSDLKPINITQPEGPSFSVEGNMVCLGSGGPGVPFRVL